MIFVTADPHFYHENVIEYCGRPFKNVDRMNNHIVNMYNKVVGPDDECYIIGDFSLSTSKRQLQSILQRLNGKKHLVAGNHDRLSVYDYLDIGFSSVCGFIGDDQTANRTSLHVNMCHDPCHAQVQNSSWLCGHVHNTYQSYYNEELDCAIVNVGVDVWDYTPQELGGMVDIMSIARLNYQCDEILNSEQIEVPASSLVDCINECIFIEGEPGDRMYELLYDIKTRAMSYSGNVAVPSKLIEHLLKNYSICEQEVLRNAAIDDLSVDEELYIALKYRNGRPLDIVIE